VRTLSITVEEGAGNNTISIISRNRRGHRGGMEAKCSLVLRNASIIIQKGTRKKRKRVVEQSAKATEFSQREITSLSFWSSTGMDYESARSRGEDAPNTREGKTEQAVCIRLVPLSISIHQGSLMRRKSIHAEESARRISGEGSLT